MSFRNDERIFIWNVIKRLINRVDGIRMLLSCEQELCLLARGSLDSSIIYNAGPWDMASGCLIVREAGGIVTNWSGDDWKTSDKTLIASNGKNHDLLVKIINES